MAEVPVDEDVAALALLLQRAQEGLHQRVALLQHGLQVGLALARVLRAAEEPGEAARAGDGGLHHHLLPARLVRERRERRGAPGGTGAWA